jgi:signal transduction histidine kinase
MNILLNSLLELAQINPENPLQISPVRIDEILYQSIQLVKHKYSDRKIVVKMEYPENSNDLLIDANAGLLNIAFKNLVENACKFSVKDIEIELVIDELMISVSINDKGIGIPSDELQSIYDPFKRASNATFKGGFGIGLTLVKRIVELHQAWLNVESTLNYGTSFKLKFRRFIQ